MSDVVAGNVQNLEIVLDDKNWDGTYSNFALITHSPSEFVIDFARVVPGINRAKVHARVIMTPQHAKMLRDSLTTNIEKFENQFGEIKTPSEPLGGRQIGFAAPHTVKGDETSKESG